MDPGHVDIESKIDFEEKAETAIKLEDEKLTRANDQFKKDFNPIFGNLSSPSNSHEAVTTQLASLYEDSNYGPGWFQESARLLKSLLIEYKALKNDPTCEMFFLNKTKTGIHIHFNTVTKKKEVVIPIGYSGMDPVRIDMEKFRSWYKKRRVAAIAARTKTQEEIRGMRIKVAKAAVDQAFSGMEQYRAESAMKEALLEAYRKEIIGIDELRNQIKKQQRKVCKPKEEFLLYEETINKLEAEKGMYVEKFFLEKKLKVLETTIKKYNVVRDIYISFTDEILLL